MTQVARSPSQLSLNKCVLSSNDQSNKAMSERAGDDLAIPGENIARPFGGRGRGGRRPFGGRGRGGGRPDGMGRWSKLAAALLEASTTFGTEDVPTRADADLIEPGLYLGSIGAALNLGWLKRVGVTHILSVMASWSADQPQSPDDAAFQRRYVPITDASSTDIRSHFAPCYRWIAAAHAQNGVVLVHCQAGVSRSATIVCSYLMRRDGLGRDAALELLRDKRSKARPNPGFMRQLAGLQTQTEAHRKRLVTSALRNIAPETLRACLIETILHYIRAPIQCDDI